jgi:hypothetical protein
MVGEKEKEKTKIEFELSFNEFISTLKTYVSTEDKEWTIKGFIDVFKNIYTISTDTKVLSKILELHIFPKILEFSKKIDYSIVLSDHQNYYPDLTFINNKNEIKFAVDFKSTFRLEDKPDYCNGFTLGSHGKYFINRDSSTNIQFPYNEYSGHYCLGIIYSRVSKKKISETKVFKSNELKRITSVLNDFSFFFQEKWRIASDRQGSHNTANIGSIYKIIDLENGNGVFKNLNEKWFDDYWMNYGKIIITQKDGKTKKLSTLHGFLEYKGKDISLANPIDRPKKGGKE